MLRWTTAGESHGQALIALLEHMPAGVPITSDDISTQLARRRLGYGRGARMKFEADEVTMLTGVRHGQTLGSPIMIGNTEWPKWTTIMSADPIDTSDPDIAAAMNSGRGAKLTRPRPGHADFAGMLKYDMDEARPILERASARETAARVAVATVARNFLRETLGVEVLSHVISIGESEPYQGPIPTFSDLDAIDASPVRAYDSGAEQDMITQIEAAKKAGDTLGGVVEVIVHGPSDWARTSPAMTGSTPNLPQRLWVSKPSRASKSATVSPKPDAADPKPTTKSFAPTLVPSHAPATAPVGLKAA